ncbi:MAG: hypothetical protein H8F28_18065 [Fibrella sp.]|nr:hypothetical protein [Armatimonadota bacterium]
MALSFSGATLKQAMDLIPAGDFIPWQLNVPPLPASDVLTASLQRIQVFDLKNSEAAKSLLIDLLFTEIAPLHPPLKIWKTEPLVSDVAAGVADYLFAPKKAFLVTPLLCVAEAKRDNFVQGEAQCVAEMVACRWINKRDDLSLDVYGIVSNGQEWVFYRLTAADEIFVTDTYSLRDLPELLGVLDQVCAACAKNAQLSEKTGS